MASVGSVQELSIDGRRFTPPADNDIGRVLGGFENEVLPNGDGSVRLKKERKPFKLDSVQAASDDELGDQEYLQEVADRHNLVPINITLVDGRVYQGVGQVIGEISYSTMNGLTSFGLSGQATLVAA